MVYFQEKQTFASWVYWVVFGSFVPVLIPFFVTPPSAWLMIGLTVVLPTLALVGGTALLLLLQTEVTDEEIHARLGVGPGLLHKRVALADITRFEAVTYSAIDCGGWGFKGVEGIAVVNARGDRGVQMWLRDGSAVIVGSQEPERLRAAIAEARRGHV